MSALIAMVRTKIGDPAGASQQFSDDDIQSIMDQHRLDLRYEPLIIAPSIVNNTNTNNQASTIFADFYSNYGFFESDVTLQAYSNGQAWVVVTPVAMELLIDQAHFQFETNVFSMGTVPGQLPPVFCTGKSFCVFSASADLLEMWAATMTGAYDISVDGQNLRRSQMPQMKLTLAQQYRKRARPKVAKMVRSDIMPAMDTQRMRLLDSGDLVK
jgi:hypothetical protein